MATIFYLNKSGDSFEKIKTTKNTIETMLYKCDECYTHIEIGFIPKSKLIICERCNAVNLLEAE